MAPRVVRIASAAFSLACSIFIECDPCKFSLSNVPVERIDRGCGHRFAMRFDYCPTPFRRPAAACRNARFARILHSVPALRVQPASFSGLSPGAGTQGSDRALPVPPM